MKNTIGTVTTANIVVGRDAQVILKMAEFDIDYTLFFNTALAEVKAGKTVGIVPRNPVNSKAHIAEVQTVITAIQNKIAEESVAMTTIETIKSRILEVNAELAQVNALKESIRSLEKYNDAVARFNALTREHEQLTRDLQAAVNAQGVKLINPADMTKEERTEMEVLARWKDRNIGGAAIKAHLPSDEDYSKRKKNPAFKEIGNGFAKFMHAAIANQKSFDMMVHQIVPFPKKDRQDRVGYVIFQVPAGLLEVKQWNGKAFENLPMEDFDYNAFNSSRARLTYGSGFLKLAIKENAEGVFVSWPKSKGKEEGVFYDVFQAREAKFMDLPASKDNIVYTIVNGEAVLKKGPWNGFNSDTNYNVQAALSAFVRVFWAEYTLYNPANRAGFNEHCGNCRHLTYIAINDQMGDDYENKINPVDTSELGQWGSKIPQWICNVNKEFVDGEAIDDLNESTSYEINTYYDEKGDLRFLRANEVLIKGKPVHMYNVRAEATAGRCAECPFYSKSERKSKDAYSREVREKDGAYVAKFWTDRAQADRMPVFTEHMEAGSPVWSLGFPGEFEAPTQFMIQGIGHINAYGTAEIMASMPKQFIAGEAAFKAEEAEINKLINIVHQVCNRFTTIEPDTLSNLGAMIQSTRKPTAQPMLARYERAMQRLIAMIQQNQE